MESVFDEESYKQLYNNLEIGIVVFKGDSTKQLHPFFCNDYYLQLSGFTNEQFKSSLVQECLYCVHPADIADARKCFAQSFQNKSPLKHSLRVKGPKDKNYNYVSMVGKIKYNEDDTFELILIFNEISQDYNTQIILLERYQNLIEKAKQNAKNTLSTILYNVTKNTITRLYKDIKTKNLANDENNLFDFITSASQNITDIKIRKQFLLNHTQEALVKSFEQGYLRKTEKLPLLLANNQIMWCNHEIHLTRNPDTNDLECIMVLTEDDKSMRINKSFNCIMNHDYDIIANLSVSTGMVTVLNVNNSRGVDFSEKYIFYHSEVLKDRMERLVPQEFVEQAIQSFQIKKIVNELKTKDKYVFTYPAKKNENEEDKVYQWRFYYLDETKEEILFTRNEMLGFLDNKQKANILESELQKSINTEAEKSTKGLSKRNKILIADDSDINREMLSIIFESNFTILQAADGEEAIHLIDKNYDTIALILLDMKMPKKTGLDVLIHLKMRNLTKVIPTMLVSGSTSKELGLLSFEYGISDIIIKPFDSKIVKRRALNLIELYTHKEEVENQLRIWKEDALILQEQQERNNELLINALSSVVEFRSVESGTHIKRVRALTQIMLKTWVILEPDVKLSELDIEQIARASTLHDIGKVAIPDNILLKPGRLTPDEFDIMKTHTTLGCQMLEQFKQDDNDFYKYCYDICRYHHERCDGKGYPDGLTEEKIPFWSQIVSIVDVYDALISPRVYKEAFSSEKAIKMIQNGECGNFSPRLLKVFDAAKEIIITESERMAEKK